MSTTTSHTSDVNTTLSNSSPLDQSLDTPGPGILHLEHINLEHPCQQLTALFYTSLLSLTLDPHRTCSTNTLWFNIGQQQFHIQSKGEKQCKTSGAVGLVLTAQRWDEIDSRWQEMQSLQPVKSTQLSVQRCMADRNTVKVQLVCNHWNVSPHQHQQSTNETKQEQQGDDSSSTSSSSSSDIAYYRIVGPWGQLYDVYRSTNTADAADTMGLAYIEDVLPHAALSDVAKYYRHYFRTDAEVVADTDGSSVAAITVGARQRLLYRASPATATTQPPATPSEATWHYCVYLGPFAGIYRAMEADGLVYSWSEGRSDCVNDWMAAVEAKQFRGFDVRVGAAGEVVWRVEQELRCGQHRHYNRRLVNETQERPKHAWAELQLSGIHSFEHLTRVVSEK